MAVLPAPVLRDANHDKNAYRGFAMAQMRILIDYMKVAGLNSYSRTVTLANGVVITCKKCFNREDVFIDVPVMVEIPAELNGHRYWYSIANESSMTTGMFRWLWGTAVPSVGLIFSGEPAAQSVPLFPYYSGQATSPKYNQLEYYNIGVVDLAGMLEYQTPILSIHDESVLWLKSYLHYSYETQKSWAFISYLFGGYEDIYHPYIRTKVLLINGNAIEYEADFVTPSFLISRDKLQHGEFYRRIRKQHPAELPAIQPTADFADGQHDEELFAYVHDGWMSGTLYRVTEDVTDPEFPFLQYSEITGLPALPSGEELDIDDVSANPGCRKVNYNYDIFSSEEADHYYLVKVCADNVIHNDAYNGFIRDPGYILFFAGNSLTVEKRLKTDFSLVTSYNLVPSGLDWALQETTDVHQVYCVENAAKLYGIDIIEPRLTRMFAVGPGQVLVTVIDGVKTEYPLLPVIVCLQDLLESNSETQAAIDVVRNYRENAIEYYAEVNLYQQAALLWLGGTAVEAYTWPDVDACGLKITDSNGIADSTALGYMRAWGDVIGDSNAVLGQLLPHNSFGYAIFDEPAISPSQCVVNIYNTPALDFNQLPAVAAYYNFKLLLRSGGNRYSFDLSTITDMAYSIASYHAAVVSLFAAAGLTATYLSTDGNGYSKFTITSPEELDIDLSYSCSDLGISSLQQVVSVRIVDGTPTVRLEIVQDQTRTLRMYEV